MRLDRAKVYNTKVILCPLGGKNGKNSVIHYNIEKFSGGVKVRWICLNVTNSVKISWFVMKISSILNESIAQLSREKIEKISQM